MADPRVFPYKIQEGNAESATPSTYDDLVRKQQERQGYTQAVYAAEQGTLPSSVIQPITTAKGQLVTNNGTSQQLLSVGTPRDVPLIVDPEAPNGIRWADYSWIPSKFRRHASLQAQAAAGAPIYQGWTSSAAFTGNTAGGAEADGAWVVFTTSNVLNNSVGIDATPATGTLTYPDWKPAVTWRVKTGGATDIANVRIWFAVLFFSGGTIALTDSPNDSIIGFRYSTAAGDTNWMVYTCDTLGATTATSTGVAVTANTAYTFGFVMASQTSCKIYVNDNLTNTITSRLPIPIPDASAALGITIRITNLSAGTTRAVKFEQMKCSMD